MRADRDLETILHDGLRDFGGLPTRTHLAGFDRIFGLLRRHPEAGQVRADLGQNVRTFSHHPHRIVYRIEADRILILRIIHAARDSRGLVKRNS
jgi:toxin ParE1/3/4